MQGGGGLSTRRAGGRFAPRAAGRLPGQTPGGGDPCPRPTRAAHGAARDVRGGVPRAGHRLIDPIGEFLEALPAAPVTRGETPAAMRALVTAEPAAGRRPGPRLLETRPRCSSSTRSSTAIRASSATSPRRPRRSARWPTPRRGRQPERRRLGLSPIATRDRAPVVRWIARARSASRPTTAGILVSGGNMANFVGFLAARRAKGG